MRSIQKFKQELVVPISKQEAWRLLSDTAHLNRVLGLFKVQYGSVETGKTGVYRTTFTHLIGSYKLRWKEFPFQWKKGEYYNNLREYENGPMKSFLTSVELYDDDQVLEDGSKATRIVLGAEVLSANLIGDLLIPSAVNNSIRKMYDYTYEYLRLKTAGKVYAIPQTKLSLEVNIATLDRLLAELEKTSANPAYTPLFRDHLINQSDDEVIDMRPFYWAQMWEVDRDELLRFFLYATNVGILNLGWHLICPNCRVSKSMSDTLSDVAQQYHCDFCGVNYDVSLDKYMELCFSVHSSIRKAYKALFCIGGPAITPHIYLQSYVRRGAPVELTAPDHVQGFRLRVLKANHSVNFNMEPSFSANSSSATEPISLKYTEQGWPVEELTFTADRHKIILENETENDIIVVFEKIDWDDITVTAAKVNSMNEFRRMFSSEVLAPGHEVSIENVTFFFSDLLGSTIFYEEVGDAHAYGQVRKHFDFLMQWIHQNNGSIVKTIGDAVMAVFERPEDGVKAALDIQFHLADFNRFIEQDQAIVIKIGIHTGPAIAVNSNDRMDYFGRNVNIAARVQGLSRGNDIAINSSCLEHPQVVELLEAADVTIKEYETALRGIERKQKVYQIMLRNR